MKKTAFIRLIAFLCLFMIFFSLSSVATEAKKEFSLSLHYRYDIDAFEGLEIKSYLIATSSNDGTYTLTDEFSKTPVSIYGIDSESERKNIASTISAYAAADKITPTYSAKTDSNGIVKFEKMKPGIYLTSPVQTQVPTESGSRIYTFECFLTFIPQANNGSEYNYDVKSTPRCKIFIPTDEQIGHKVVKQWKDESSPDKRSSSATVDILKNGELQYTETLSSQNNWCFSWSAPNDGAIWQAVERGVQSGYSVTITDKSNTVIITNTAATFYSEPIITGESVFVWPFILIVFTLGIILIIFATWKKRNEL